MLVKSQNYVISVYRFNVMLVKIQNYLISVYRCNMLVKTQNSVISVLTHLCSQKRKFANIVYFTDMYPFFQCWQKF